MPISPDISAIILAGGQGRRMDFRNKGLIEFEGQPLIEHVISRLQGQVGEIIISANADKEQYERYGLTVVSDKASELLGPLAGIAAGLKNVHSDYTLIVPCDCPFVPLDLAARMLAKLSNTQQLLCLAQDAERIQPLFALLHRSLLPSLEKSLELRELKVGRWMTEQAHCLVVYDEPWVFFNINTPEELQEAIQSISQNPSARIQ